MEDCRITARKSSIILATIRFGSVWLGKRVKCGVIFRTVVEMAQRKGEVGGIPLLRARQRPQARSRARRELEGDDDDREGTRGPSDGASKRRLVGVKSKSCILTGVESP